MTLWLGWLEVTLSRLYERVRIDLESVPLSKWHFRQSDTCQQAFLYEPGPELRAWSVDGRGSWLRARSVDERGSASRAGSEVRAADGAWSVAERGSVPGRSVQGWAEEGGVVVGRGTVV